MNFLPIVVQIIIESLPISSSGHLQLFGFTLSRAAEYLLHGPTVAMFVVYFFDRWSPMVLHAWRLRGTIGRMLLYGFCAELVTVPVYALFSCVGGFVPLWIGFLITALTLWSLRYASLQARPVTAARAALIGCVQGMAAVPGVSRLATTYTAGVWLGLHPRIAFLFSCMIQWPLMLAGFCYGLWSAGAESLGFITPGLLAITLAATVVAYYLLWVVQRMATTGSWYYFSYYLLVPCIMAAIC